jgi:hypothetical protein
MSDFLGGHPMIVNLSLQILGWGPSVTIFWWEKRCADYLFALHWRYMEFQISQFEMSVQWL